MPWLYGLPPIITEATYVRYLDSNSEAASEQRVEGVRMHVARSSRCRERLTREADRLKGTAYLLDLLRASRRRRDTREVRAQKAPAIGCGDSDRTSAVWLAIATPGHLGRARSCSWLERSTDRGRRDGLGAGTKGMRRNGEGKCWPNGASSIQAV